MLTRHSLKNRPIEISCLLAMAVLIAGVIGVVSLQDLSEKYEDIAAMHLGTIQRRSDIKDQASETSSAIEPVMDPAVLRDSIALTLKETHAAIEMARGKAHQALFFASALFGLGSVFAIINGFLVARSLNESLEILSSKPSPAGPKLPVCVHKETIVSAGVSQNSKKIESIINLIDEMAFQTNLLALNAAVESADSGEPIKGCAAVAEAIRSLSPRSESTRQDNMPTSDHSSQSQGLRRRLYD